MGEAKRTSDFSGAGQAKFVSFPFHALGCKGQEGKRPGRNGPGPSRHGYISHPGMFECAVWVCGASGTDPWAFIVPWLQAAPSLAAAPLLAITGRALAAKIATMINATVRTKAMRLNSSPLLPLVPVWPTPLLGESFPYL